MVDWCWEGECVRYGRLVDLDSGDVISQGRFKCSDVDKLNSRFQLQETTPEEVGELRDDGKPDECSFFNDFKFPPIFPPVIPATLILDVKNNVTNSDLSPQTVRLELIPNSEIDRNQLVRVVWDFGDGTPTIDEEGLAGQRIGFIQDHIYQNPINFNGTVTLQLLNNETRSVIDSETSTFAGQILAEPQITPLSLIIDVFSDSEQAPANVVLEIIGNQAIDNISINYGDGSNDTTSKTHKYNLNGNYIIGVTARSKASGEVVTQNVNFDLSLPPLPPGEDQVIFDIRKTESNNFPNVPSTVNYKVTLNPLFDSRLFGVQTTWTLNGVETFKSEIKEGDKATGLSQSYEFKSPGFQNVNFLVEIFERKNNGGITANVFLKQEFFNDSFQILDEPVIVDPTIPEIPTIECIPGFHEENGVCVANAPPPNSCEIGFHEENGVCVADTISCPLGSHEENGICIPNPPPEESKNNTVRNVVIAGVAVAVGIAAVSFNSK